MGEFEDRPEVINAASLFSGYPPLGITLIPTDGSSQAPDGGAGGRKRPGVVS